LIPAVPNLNARNVPGTFEDDFYAPHLPKA
jgi:hypothetical protein